MRLSATLLASGFALLISLAWDVALAAPPWVERHLTLPQANWAFDFGLGFAHDSGPDISGVGINAEMGVGVTERVELGVRTGFRIGDVAERSLQADQFGRLFDRQTFGTGADVLANPELRVRGALVRHRVVELALEGRITLPFEDGTQAALLFGVPLSFHLGDRVRLDTGAYVPVVFARPAYFDIRLPLDVWIQVSPRFWLGPMTGIELQHPGDMRSRALASLGFGFGYEITHYLDFKAMLLFPAVNDEPRLFGAGAGVQIRIE